MLFQPTNITPDVLGGTGNGTVDPTKTLSVSWQVNGSSPLVAFQIDFYQNTTSQTVIYSTGKISDGCPFYGTNSLGVRQTFVYTGTGTYASVLGASSGEFKMVITQWWNSNDSVVQSSPSVFTLKSAPTLSINTPNVTTKDYTFTANYSQANGDVLNWVRWEIGIDNAYNQYTNIIQNADSLTADDFRIAGSDLSTVENGIVTAIGGTGTGNAKMKLPYTSYANMENRQIILAFDARPISGEYSTDSTRARYLIGFMSPADINALVTNTNSKYNQRTQNFSGNDWQRMSSIYQIPNSLTSGSAIIEDDFNLAVRFTSDPEVNPTQYKNFSVTLVPAEQEIGVDITTLYDTGKIYGTSELSCYYDGFFTDKHYVVRCSIETQSGVQVTTGWIPFMPLYPMTDLGGVARAQKMCDGSSAVKVTWDGYTYITGEPSEGASYSFSSDGMTLTNGTITWNEVNGEPMSLETPWNVMYRGTITANSTSLLKIESNADDVELSYSYATRVLTLTTGANTYTYSPAQPDDIVSLAVTPDMAYVRVEGLRGGLYPSETLFPTTRLYPKDDATMRASTYSNQIAYTQGEITAIIVSAEQTADFVQAVTGELPEDVISSLWTEGNYEVYGINGTRFMTQFENGGLDAGSLFFGDIEVIGWAVYREQSGNPVLQHITDAGVATSSVLDYGVRSQQGTYKYYVYPIGDTSYISDTMQTETVNPCFWNWSLLETMEIDTGRYQVLNEFTFGKNLSSGSISNNNSPTILNNFTKFPTVQLTSDNYLSGTLESLIGMVGANATYSDTIAVRDSILNLSSTRNPLFLKDRKGDLMQIRISAPITFSYMDNTREQAITVSIPWIEVADATSVSIIG